ncbi:hypothetical protein [Desulfosporosinus sp. FKA]|uniref:hypothetical protein n=1 Tax=Desulfosporosinus sp. FKA TaxID=1969834 RepID=UPI000B49FF10|nr:hypothetical protein [Desulfosporosinus sp. FKA]
MIMPNMIYDIRTTEYAQQTLTNLTGVPIPVWKQYLGHEREYKYTDYLVADVINSHGNLPRSYRDFEFVYFHVTTSANGCASFREYGILDLKQSYSCHDSELREFLEKHDIHINLDERILTYRGQVHRRPEILMDIDNLLGLNLSREWMSTHDSYEIVAKVSGEKVIYDSDDDQNEEDKVLNYLTKAYLTAFGEPSENILLIKNHIQIPPMDILEIKPMEHWKDC